MNYPCPKREMLVFDVETTGIPLDGSDSAMLEHEVLQLTMLNGHGEVLFNRMFCPVRLTSWPDAEAVHGISFEDVRDKPSIYEYKKEIQQLVDNSKLLIAYNFQFDYLFLRSIGVSFVGHLYCDVMRQFASRYGLKRGKRSKAFVSLEQCAGYFGYQISEAHSAVGDAQATLHCYMELRRERYGKEECR